MKVKKYLNTPGPITRNLVRKPTRWELDEAKAGRTVFVTDDGLRLSYVPNGYSVVNNSERQVTTSKNGSDQYKGKVLDEITVTAPYTNKKKEQTTYNELQNKPLYEYTPAQLHVENVGLSQTLTENVGKMYDGKSHPLYEAVIEGMNDVGNLAAEAITIPAGGGMAKGIFRAIKAGAYKPLLKAILGSQVGMQVGNKITKAMSNGQYNSTAEMLHANGANKYNSIMADPFAWIGGATGVRFRNGGFDIGNGRVVRPVKGNAYSNLPLFEVARVVEPTSNNVIDLSADQFNSLLRGSGASSTVRTIGGTKYVSVNGKMYRYQPGFDVLVEDPDVRIIEDPDVRVISRSTPRTKSTYYPKTTQEPESYYTPEYTNDDIYVDPSIFDSNYGEAGIGDIDFGDIFSIFKKGGYMKRKLLKKGGDIPKFEKPSGKIHTVNYGIGTVAVDSSGRKYWEWAKPKSAGYSSATDRAVARARLANNPKLSVQPQSTRLLNLLSVMRTGNKEQKAAALSQYYRDKGDLKLAEIYAKAANYYKTRALNPSKLLPKGTTGNSLKPINPRGNTNSVINTNNTTSNSSPTNITNQDWLTARNNAMTRGYASYIHNGLTYTFTGDDLKNARNNWRINRGRLNNEALGLLGITTSENKPVETMLPAITLTDTDRVLAEVDANIKANSPRLLLTNDGMYGVLSALKNPGASVAGLSYARLNGNKGVGEYNKQNTSPAFYDQITNWYANNKPTIDNYFNSNTNYSQDFNLKVLNFLDRYKLYRPKYAFVRNGSKLLKSNN